MKKVILIFLLLTVFACKEENKTTKENNAEIPKVEQSDNPEVVIQELDIPPMEAWDIRNVSLIETEETFNGQKTYNMEVKNDAGSYALTAINSVKLNYTGGKYRISMIVKKGAIGHRFGLRIQEAYPVRTDAVFDLNTQEALEVFKEEDLTNNEKAEIEPLGDGWFKCTLTADIHASYFRLAFGPSDDSKSVGIWESQTNVEKKPKVLFIPSSVKIEELEE